MDGRELRIQRLMGDGRAVVIAFDHGLFDGPIPGMENLPETATKINPVVDAVLLAPGMIRHCGSVFSKPKRPLAMVRLNWNTVYCFGFGYKGAKSVYCYEPLDALREGMDIALVSLTLKTGDEFRDAANVPHQQFQGRVGFVSGSGLGLGRGEAAHTGRRFVVGPERGCRRGRRRGVRPQRDPGGRSVCLPGRALRGCQKRIHGRRCREEVSTWING